MSSKKNILLYAPPVAIDLSGNGAIGQQVIEGGMCVPGQYPYYSCNTGNTFQQRCTAGATADTSICETGALHIYPGCNPGASASTTCISGAHQNF
jgi:hypothetical protein